MGQRFHGAGDGEHDALPGEDCVDARAEAWPFGLWQVEVAAEIEAGDLADLLSRAFGGDEVECEIGFGGGFIPGLGFTNEPDG